MLNIFLILTIYFQTAVLETLQYSDRTLAVLLRFGIWKYVVKPRTKVLGFLVELFVKSIETTERLILFFLKFISRNIKIKY